MKHVVQFIGIIIGLACLAGGLIDIYVQFKAGETIQWRMPLILIGTGAGLPFLIFPFMEFGGSPDFASMTEEEYIKYGQENFNDSGVMGSISSGSGESSYSGGDCGGAGGGD